MIKQEEKKSFGRCCGKEVKSQWEEGLFHAQGRDCGTMTQVMGHGKSIGKNSWESPQKGELRRQRLHSQRSAALWVKEKSCCLENSCHLLVRQRGNGDGGNGTESTREKPSQSKEGEEFNCSG